MRVGIFGTGSVGRTLASKFAALGHEVMMGTRDVGALMARLDMDAMGNRPFPEWFGEQTDVEVGTFAEAAAHGEILFNCTAGSASVAAISHADDEALTGKILVDVANPLDFSKGYLRLTLCNDDSLGEEIQRAFPDIRVVKALNTVTAGVMVNPSLVPGSHDLFICGNDDAAKAEVTRVLKEWLGWETVIDVGDITAARGTEMLMPLWIRLMGAVGSPMFNWHVAREGGTG